MGRLGGEAAIEIDLAIADCFRIAADIERAPEWQEDMLTATVVDLDRAGRPELVETIVEAKVRQIRSLLRFGYEEPVGIRWTQERGDLKSLEGSWRFVDLGGGRTHATYTMHGDPGFVLGQLVRGPVSDRLRDRLVTRMPGAFKAYVER